MLLIASCVARPPALRITPSRNPGPKNCSGTQRGSRQVTLFFITSKLNLGLFVNGNEKCGMMRKSDVKSKKKTGIWLNKKNMQLTDQTCLDLAAVCISDSGATRLDGGCMALAHIERVLPCLCPLGVFLKESVERHDGIWWRECEIKRC